MAQLLILFHFSLDLSEHGPNHIVRRVGLPYRHLEISLFLLVCELNHLHVGVPLFLEPLNQLRLNAAHLLLKNLRLPQRILACSVAPSLKLANLVAHERQLHFLFPRAKLTRRRPGRQLRLVLFQDLCLNLKLLLRSLKFVLKLLQFNFASVRGLCKDRLLLPELVSRADMLILELGQFLSDVFRELLLSSL